MTHDVHDNWRPAVRSQQFVRRDRQVADAAASRVVDRVGHRGRHADQRQLGQALRARGFECVPRSSMKNASGEGPSAGEWPSRGPGTSWLSLLVLMCSGRVASGFPARKTEQTQYRRPAHQSHPAASCLHR
jgi:hypothetical protein